MVDRRATLIVDVHRDPDGRARLDAWFARWEAELSHRSDNLGCGCCVDIFEVAAPDDALAELPGHLLGGGDWSDPPPPDAAPNASFDPPPTERVPLAARLRHFMHTRRK